MFRLLLLTLLIATPSRSPLQGARKHLATHPVQASLRLIDATATLRGRYPQDAKVRVQLVPLAPLLDGSTGRPVLLEFDSARMRVGDQRTGIPPGSYRASAWIVTAAGQRKPLGLSLHQGRAFENWVDSRFEPDSEAVELLVKD